MVTRDEVVAEARKWLGTKYRHQGRLMGVGVDCAGLLVCVGQALGLPVMDFEGYPRRPDGTLLAGVRAQTLPVAPGQEGPGDIVLFHWHNEPMHLGILIDKSTLIHAFAINRVVCEHSIDDKWRAQIAAFRRYKGVE